MQVHLTAAAIELQDKQTQSARESLSVREFRASNSTAFIPNGINESIYKVKHGGWKLILSSNAHMSHSANSVQ